MRCAAGAAQRALQRAARCSAAASSAGPSVVCRLPTRDAGACQPPAAARRVVELRRRASLGACGPLPASRRGARRRAASHSACVARGPRWQSELEELASERAGGDKAPPPRTAGKGFGSAAPVNFARRAPLVIVKYPDPRLRAPNADVTVFDDALRQLAADMFTIMYKTDGVGLAAPQVGVNKRLMVYNPEGVRGRGVETVLCNPVVVESSAEQELFEEGCLSFPRIYADVMRPVSVVVEFQDASGAKQRMALDGLQARIFQHEFDHTQGVLFQDRMSPEVLETVTPQLQALERDWEAAQKRGAKRK